MTQRVENQADPNDELDESEEESEDDSNDSHGSQSTIDEAYEHWYDDSEADDEDHPEGQNETIVSAADQAELIHAREEILISLIAAGEPTPLGPLVGKWNLFSTQHEGEEMSRQKMSLFNEWWDEPEKHDFCLACSPGHCPTQSMRSCGEFFFGPLGSVPRDVIQFNPPTIASLDQIPIYLSSAREP
jgi:hypothetical protein